MRRGFLATLFFIILAMFNNILSAHAEPTPAESAGDHNNNSSKPPPPPPPPPPQCDTASGSCNG